MNTVCQMVLSVKMTSIFANQCVRSGMKRGKNDTSVNKVTTENRKLKVFKGNKQDRLTHVQLLFTWNLSPLQSSKFSFECKNEESIRQKFKEKGFKRVRVS